MPRGPSRQSQCCSEPGETNFWRSQAANEPLVLVVGLSWGIRLYWLSFLPHCIMGALMFCGGMLHDFPPFFQTALMGFGDFVLFAGDMVGQAVEKPAQ